MTWEPERPVLTEADKAEWLKWRKERRRPQRRERRARYPRIDYDPDKSALALIDSLRRPHAGGDASSIINRIAAEWLEAKRT